jgi:hypothetical protein
MTVSKVSFGDPTQPFNAEEHYRSTTQRAFVKYSKDEVRDVRPPQMSAYSSSHLHSGPSMTKVSTTHDHFEQPDTISRRAPIKPVAVNKNRLFPLLTTGKGSHWDAKTTQEEYYSKRDALYGQNIVNVKRKSNNGSSIVL